MEGVACGIAIGSEMFTVWEREFEDSIMISLDNVWLLDCEEIDSVIFEFIRICAMFWYIGIGFTGCTEDVDS